MSSNQPGGSSLGGMSSLDRKAMEEARLARARKRERSISPPLRSRASPKLEPTASPEKVSAATTSNKFSSAIQQDQRNRKPAGANAAVERMKAPSSTLKAESTDSGRSKPETLPQGSIKYPRGVVKKTWAFGHDRTGNEVKIEEVLEPLSLRTAVLSAFQWDLDWVLSKLKTPLNGGVTKCIFVMQAKGSEERAKMRKEAEDSGMASFMRLCLPPMYGPVWCMHSKLMLLFHPEKLRVAIPTANLLNFDWGETGQMENTVFMIDLPRLSSGAQTSEEELPSFGKELRWFLEMQRLDQDVRDGLLNFDFSATKDLAFVHTAGGVHYKQYAERTGLLGLRRTIQTLGLASSQGTLALDFAASSIGQLNDKYLQDFYTAASGTTSAAVATAAKATKSSAAATFFQKKQNSGAYKSKSSSSQQNLTSLAHQENLRVYFPTAQTVRSSIAGATGTVCLQRSYFEAPAFPRACFRDYTSTRAGLLSHNKILCARGKSQAAAVVGGGGSGGRGGQDLAWLYIGSANLSKSAWGELPADRKEVKITCRNWECGVVVPVLTPSVSGASPSSRRAKQGRQEKHPGELRKKARRKGPHLDGEEDSETQSDAEDSETGSDEEDHAEAENDGEPLPLVDMRVFQPVLDLPFKVPGEKYAGREPWYFKEQQ